MNNTVLVQAHAKAVGFLPPFLCKNRARLPHFPHRWGSWVKTPPYRLRDGVESDGKHACRPLKRRGQGYSGRSQAIGKVYARKARSFSCSKNLAMRQGRPQNLTQSFSRKLENLL